MIKIAVAVSGQGRSLENLIAHQILNKTFKVEFVCASKPGIQAINIAKNNHIPCEIIPFRELGSKKASEKLFKTLDEREIDFLVLAGFLNQLEIMDTRWEKRCINIHPALLPKFGGKGMYGHRVHQAVIDNQETISGATVHIVNNLYDDGPIIGQIIVNISKHDDPNTLANKVFKAECELLPHVLNLISKKGIDSLTNEKLLLNWDETF